jgi:hypothetical protein
MCILAVWRSIEALKGAHVTMASSPHIRSLILARPFQPFVLRLADGRSFEIAHPEYVAMQQKSLNFIVSTEDDAVHYIDIPNILEVEVLPEGVKFMPPENGNGA